MPININTKEYSLVSYATGGTLSLPTTDPYELYILSGAIIPSGNIIVQPTGSVILGMTYNIKFTADVNIVTNGTTFTVFGKTLTKEQCSKDCEINCFYNGTSWEVDIILDSSESGIITNSQIASDASIDNSKLSETAKSVYLTFDVSFESGSQLPVKIYLYDMPNGCVIKHISATVKKDISGTDDARISFYTAILPGTPMNLLTAASNIWNIGQSIPAASNFVKLDEFTSPSNTFIGSGIIHAVPSKTTPGGIVTVTVQVIKL